MSEELILIHHGIKGQKWGVKNGPPYPLGASQKSPAEKRRARVHRPKATDMSKARSTKADTDDESNAKDANSKKRRFQLSDKQKRALKIGAAAVGTALVAYGTYRLIKSDRLDPNTFLDSQLKRKTVEAADFETQIKDDLKKINRGLPGHFLLRGRENNCTSCSMAYEMRRRGYDVIAGKTSEGRSSYEMRGYFKGDVSFDALHGNAFLRTKPTAAELNDVVNKLLSQGEGARGIINGQYVHGGGHSIAYEVHGGKVYFVEGQSGKIYKDATDALGKMYASLYLRTDNLALDNSAAETVRNRTAVSWLRESPSDYALMLVGEYVPTAAIIAYSAVASAKNTIVDDDSGDNKESASSTKKSEKRLK